MSFRNRELRGARMPARSVPPPIRPGPELRRRHYRPWPGTGASVRQNTPTHRTRDPARYGHSARHRPEAGQLHRIAGRGDRHQRLCAGTHPALARGDRVTLAARFQLDPLARDHLARANGRCTGDQLRRYCARSDLHLSIRRQTERYLLVSQPLRVSGADRYVRGHRHRSPREGLPRL